MKKLTLLLFLLSSFGIFSPLAYSQSGTTVVTAKVVDANGSVYVNCQWSVVFVGENTTPGAGPYAPAPLLNGQQGACDSQGNFSINLADNILTVTPQPSQWSFSICSTGGYLGGLYCKTNIPITVTGSTQNISSILTPLMPLLPTGGGGGSGTITFPGVPSGLCTSAQTAVNTATGDYYSCFAGVWIKVGPNPAAGNPGGSAFQLQTNSSGVSFGGVANATLGSVLITQGGSAFPAFSSNLLVAPSANSVPFSTSGGVAANALNVNLYNISNPYALGWENFNGLDEEYVDLGGWATNYLTPSFSKKDFLDPLYINLTSYGLGQKYAFRNNQNCYGLGDCGSILNSVTAYGGLAASGDEGTINQQLFSGMGGVEFTGTITSGASTGSTSLTINPSAGSGTQGDNRWLYDSTQKIVVTISALTPSTVAPASMTVTSTGLGASTVNTTLSNNVGPCTPCTITPVSMTGISANQILAIADNETFELVQVISTGGSTFTANLTKPHDGTTDHSIIAGGGATGYFIEVSANNGTTAMGATNTLHYAWPILSSASNTSLTVWAAANGGYETSIAQNWANVSGQNGGVIYPGAEVYSVQSGNALSNTLTLGPNIVAWSNGDTVIQPVYPAIGVSGIIVDTTSYFPSLTNFITAGLNVNFGGIATANQVGIEVRNNSPVSLYTSSYGGTGTFLPPQAALSFQGPWQADMTFDKPAPALLQVNGCPAGLCTYPYSPKLVSFPNNFGASDYITYNGNAGNFSSPQWLIAVGNGTGSLQNYLFTKNDFSPVFPQGTAASLGANQPWRFINASAGYQINGTAPISHCLTGNGTYYVDSGSCGNAAFSSITSGTNTSAAMLVGSGASLGWTSSGRIDSTTLLGGYWGAPALPIGNVAPVPGNSVFTGFSATGTVDFTGSVISKLRVAAGLTTSANGDIGYDSTNANWHFWNGADLIMAPLAAGFVSGDCGQPTLTGSKWTIADTGGACGGGGGSGLSGMTAGQVPIAATGTTITSSKALAGSGAGITTGPASAVTTLDVTEFTGTGGQIADSGVLVANLTTAASNYTSGDLVQAAGANKTTSDSAIATANVVTAASNFTSGHIPKAAASNKTLADGYAVQGTDTSLLSSGTVSGTSVLLCTDANGGATTSGCPSTGGNVSTSGTITSGQIAIWASTTTIKSAAISGDSTMTSAGVMTNTGMNGVSFASLATGIVKNTTTTGVPSIAVSADTIAQWTGTCNSSTFLRADGSCQVPSSTGGTVNVALQYAMPYYSAAGSTNTISGSPAPTSPNGIAQTWTSTPSGGTATQGVWSIPGVPIDAQTGTSYTIPITDDVTFVTGSNTSATAWTGFALANNYAFSFMNINTGLITFTPASGTVNGNATQIIPSQWFGFHYTDNTNTFMPVMPTIAAFTDCHGASNAVIFTAATGAFGCNTISGSSGLSGMTAGQVPIAATATTVTSSKALAGAGAGITTGPVSGVTTLDLTEFTGTGGQIADSGVLAANVVTQTSNGTSGQVCTYTGSNKVCVPATALPNGVTATTQTATDTSTDVSTDAFVATSIANAIAAVNPAVAVLAASTTSLTGTYANGASGVGATFTVTATGAFTLDGISISTIGQRVLLKNQSSAFQNGIYTATVVGATAISPVFTRALDYDQPSDMNTTGAIPVQSGTVNAETSWLQTSTVNTVGTDAVTFTQFSVNPANLVTAVSPGVGLCHFAGSTQACTSSAIVAADITNNTITGTQLASSLALVTPNIGAATGTSLLVTGTLDGKAPITITTGTTATLGAATYASGYTFNQEATAGTSVTYTLPATAAGLQYCVKNSIVSGTGAADTGVLKVYPASGSYVILNGTINTIGGGGTHGVSSGGAAGDSACFVAIDSTHWEVYVQVGTWAEN
jgi:hypothetical protein